VPTGSMSEGCEPCSQTKFSFRCRLMSLQCQWCSRSVGVLTSVCVVHGSGLGCIRVCNTLVHSVYVCDLRLGLKCVVEYVCVLVVVNVVWLASQRSCGCTGHGAGAYQVGCGFASRVRFTSRVRLMLARRGSSMWVR
jgi:hypothetical protein